MITLFNRIDKIRPMPLALRFVPLSRVRCFHYPSRDGGDGDDDGDVGELNTTGSSYLMISLNANSQDFRP